MTLVLGIGRPGTGIIRLVIGELANLRLDPYMYRAKEKEPDTSDSLSFGSPQ